MLARELHGEINVLIATNPVFGLDFAAVKEIHSRLRDVRTRGGAVLLISEDLDELMELADRIVVMSEGCLVFETSAAMAQRHVLGAHMGGGRHEPAAVDMGANKPWNFNNQLWFPVTGTINSGDVVKTRCAWTNPTGTDVGFGQNTEDEMCYSFTTYYPRISGLLSWAQPALTSSCTFE